MTQAKTLEGAMQMITILAREKAKMRQQIVEVMMMMPD
jgi:hypothetical protein